MHLTCLMHKAYLKPPVQCKWWMQKCWRYNISHPSPKSGTGDVSVKVIPSGCLGDCWDIWTSIITLCLHTNYWELRTKWLHKCVRSLCSWSPSWRTQQVRVMASQAQIWRTQIWSFKFLFLYQHPWGEGTQISSPPPLQVKLRFVLKN